MQMMSPPWRRDQHNSWTPTQWADRDDALTANWLQHNGINVSVQVAATAAESVAKDRSFHPIRDYLTGLRWDGKERIANCMGWLRQRWSSKLES
jgi:predicted P-loop ATPase